MRADSASHLLRQPLTFELFLFTYLVSALLLQKINIYKTNYHLVDVNLVVFTVVILSRRLAWCVFHQLQTHWNIHGGGAGGLNLRRAIVVTCTLLVIIWSGFRLIKNTSLFNLLFLFYPLLLYLSLFGFTLEPRIHRSRFEPPKRFLHHMNFASRLKHAATAAQRDTNKDSVTLCSSRLYGHVENVGSTNRRISATLNCDNHHTAGSRGIPVDSSLAKQSVLRTNAAAASLPASSLDPQRNTSEHKYTWEYSLLLPATPEEVRKEVEVLLADLIIRLKQLLFNSLLCAYYVGFIPMQFTDSHLYYDRWWCVEHAFLVWANSFVILSTHLLPPSYCQLLFQCALHLGCWTRCVHDENARIWSPDEVWLYDAVVKWNEESFRGEGLRNVAIPCDSSQECFYILFSSRLHVHSWLLVMQCIIVTFQIVVLLRAVFWFQILSMSVFLVFNYFVLYKLLYNRLQCSKFLVLS